MSDTFQDYTPTQRFTQQQLLLANHFRFDVAALPDLSFFVQSVSLPDITTSAPKLATPFSNVPQVGDHLTFGMLTAFYLLDVRAKTYFSLYYWLRGYGFPTSYDDVANFIASRGQRLGNPKPSPQDAYTTTATLTLLAPDTDSTVAEFHFTDVFPTALGSVQLDTHEHEPIPLRTQVTFAYTKFEMVLTNPQ